MSRGNLRSAAALGAALACLLALILPAAYGSAGQGGPSVEPPQNVQPPELRGLPQQGRTLRIVGGDWSGSPFTLEYRWTSCPAGGGSCTRIRGADSPTYRLTSADVAKRVQPVVIARNDEGRDRVTLKRSGYVIARFDSTPTIGAAGDIACDPLSASFNDGAGTPEKCAQMRTSRLLLGDAIDAVLALGDLQYDCGAPDAFEGSYAPSWGRVKDKTYPVIGNHEYQRSAAAHLTPCANTDSEPAKGYFEYFGGAAHGPAAYYSYDLGTWHVVALNSECGQPFVGGCGEGSPQDEWLEEDLAVHDQTCTLAYFHRPRYSSSATPAMREDANVAELWKDLYAAGVDVVLAGHTHFYERLRPLDANGLPADDGIRQFTVGTGGIGMHEFGETLPASRARSSESFGVLKMSLRRARYEWIFHPAAGDTYTDSGGSRCH